MKWHLVIDIEKCEDCNNCFLACKDEHVDNNWPGYSDSQPRHGHRWINIRRKERGQFPLIDVAYLPTPCMHCDDAPCIAAAGSQTISKRDDGIVLIDPIEAKGKKQIVGLCPYGAIWWNEKRNVPQKCTFCAHLIDAGWNQPRCVQVCPTGALKVVKTDDASMQKQVENQRLETLHPELETHPRVYYKNLHRFERCFIAGSVAVQQNGVENCAPGAAVVIYRQDRRIGETLADDFGDFKFDGLEKHSGPYTVEIHLEAFEKRRIAIDMDDSVSLGTILFEAGSGMP